jgi:hypothetical protein
VAGSSYDCVFTYASVGGVVAGNTIQYFVAAQDGAATPNVAVNPSAGASGLTANPPAAGTPPTTPSSYLISVQISGSYNVGTGETLTSLTNTGGVFEFLNGGVLTRTCRPIGLALRAHSGGSGRGEASASSPRERGEAATPSPSGRHGRPPRTESLRGAVANGMIRLNDADRISFDQPGWAAAG